MSQVANVNTAMVCCVLVWILFGTQHALEIIFEEQENVIEEKDHRLALEIQNQN